MILMNGSKIILHPHLAIYSCKWALTIKVSSCHSQMALNSKVVNMYSGGSISLNVFYIVCPIFVKLSNY